MRVCVNPCAGLFLGKFACVPGVRDCWPGDSARRGKIGAKKGLEEALLSGEGAITL